MNPRSRHPAGEIAAANDRITGSKRGRLFANPPDGHPVQFTLVLARRQIRRPGDNEHSFIGQNRACRRGSDPFSIIRMINPNLFSDDQ